jgi:hypothetical protein
MSAPRIDPVLERLCAVYEDVRPADKRFGALNGYEATCPRHKNRVTAFFDNDGRSKGCMMDCKPEEIQPNDATSKEKSEGNAKGALALVRLADECELFVDDREDAHAAIPLPGGGREIRRLKSTRFKSWLLARHYDESGQAAGRDAQDNAVRLLEAKALQSAERRQLAERFACEMVGKVVQAIWIDLGDPAWRAVRVTAEGWTVQTKSPLLFRRHEHTAPLPEPQRGGKLDELFSFLNMKEQDDRVSVLAWLLAAPFANVPRPILLLQGVQGAAKTTSARVLRSLLDPSLTEVLSPPRNEDQLVHQLGKHAVAAYDNLSTIHDWMADAFCRAVTGGASEKRAHYTDGDSVLVSYRRCLILTGINTPSDAPDLLSRALRVELEAVRPEQRREEGEFWAAFNEARPRLFGALLDALAATLRQLPETRLVQLQRMADFTRIGAAAAEALGYGQDAFLTAYEQSAGKQSAEVLDTDPVAIALRDFMNRRKWVEWEGKTGDLFKELLPEDRNSGFPKTAAVLGRRLNILRPILGQAGGADVEPVKLLEHGRGWRVRSRS